MRSSTLPALAFATLVAFSTAADADPPAPAASTAELESFLVEAAAANPTLAAATARREAAAARVAPAGALDDPMVRVSYENDGASFSLGRESMTRLGLEVEQALPLGGRLEAARRLAEAGVGTEEARVARTRRGLEADVKRAHARLLAAREARRLSDEQEATWATIAEVAAGRYAAGLAMQQDVLRAQIERTRLRQRRAREGAAEVAGERELARLLGRPVGAGVATAARLFGEPLPQGPDPDGFRAAARAESPDLAEARAEAEGARRAADVATRARFPELIASAGYMNRGSLPLMWSAGLGVSLPVFAGRKQRPAIDEARHRAAAAEAAAEDLGRRLDAATAARLARLEGLAAEVALDRDTLLVQDALSVEAALASYRTGGAPFLTVLEAIDTQFADRRAALERLVDYRVTLADLEELAIGSSAPAPAAAASPRAGM